MDQAINRIHLPRRARILGVALMLLSASGCTSFGRGVTEALLQTQTAEREDVRACTVEGQAFNGIAPILEAQAADPLSAGNPDSFFFFFFRVPGSG